MPLRFYLSAFIASAGLGCLSVAAEFECEADDQCTMNGEQGVCQQSGWCSFADGICPSGQRYSEMARSGIAGYCVPESTDDESTG